MTFAELVVEIKDRLNLSSPEAVTRIGRAVNRKYRLITVAIGLQSSRRVTTTQTATIGESTMTFTGVEKIINVVNRVPSPHKILEQVTLEELTPLMPFADGDSPTKFAIHSHTSTTVSILFDRVALSEFTLHADVHQTVADLSGSNEPAFPESYHDIIIEGVLADELRKMEKPALAKIAQQEYDRLLSDLKFWVIKSGYLDMWQGKMSRLNQSTGTGVGGGSGSSPATPEADAGLWVFHFGGTQNVGTSDTSYPAGAANVDLAVGTTVFQIDCTDLDDDFTYYVTAMLQNNTLGQTTSIELVNLTDTPNTAMVTLDSDNTTTDPKFIVSSTFAFPTDDVKQFGIKIKATAGVGSVWGVQLRLVA